MPKVPLTRDRAWAYVLLNVSIPGWGSLKAGRVASGLGEMALAFAGLFLLLAWFFMWISRVIQSEIDDTMPVPPPAWLWRAGVGCVVVCWAWTVMSCISLVRQARAYEKENSQNVPPRLSDLPKPPKLS